MTDKEKSAPSPSNDSSAKMIQDFASDPPAKDLETVKAASDALEHEDGRKKERVDARARLLWQRAGSQGAVESYRARAEVELGDEG